MPNEVKIAFVEELRRRFGALRKMDASQSLFELLGGSARVYVRYSKVHSRNQTFFGLRERDLRQLVGFPSFIAFLWDSQQEPLLVPVDEYEDVIRTTATASDGQYKVQVYLGGEATELYIAGAGRFNVEGHFGWNRLQARIDQSGAQVTPSLTHCQVQTLLGAIGTAKGYDVWVPMNNREQLDWSIAARFECSPSPLYGFDPVRDILQEVDMIWLRRGSSEPTAMFEVEHSTPIYSGLLRFNDVHLVAPRLHATFSIVANDARRDVYVRQLRRPTFQTSGLGELCNFLEYVNVFDWHRRLTATKEVTSADINSGQ